MADSSSPDSPSNAADVTPAGQPDAGSPGAKRPLAMNAIWGGVFALIAAGAAWGIHSAIEPVFVLPAKYVFDFGPPPELLDETLAATAKRDMCNRVVATTLIGALLGLCLGLGEGLARKSLVQMLLFAIGCGVFAALIGALAGFGGHLVQVSQYSKEVAENKVSLTSTVMVQGILWAILGAGVGIIVGALARPRKIFACLFAGLAGGGLGGILYPIVAGLAIPSSQTQYVVPLRSDVQLLWFALPAVLMGLMIPFAANSEKREPKAA